MNFQISDTTSLWVIFLSRNKQKASFVWKTVIFILHVYYDFVNWTEVFYRRLDLEIFLGSTFLEIFNLWKEAKFFGFSPKRNTHHGRTIKWENLLLAEFCYEGNRRNFSTKRWKPRLLFHEKPVSAAILLRVFGHFLLFFSSAYAPL